ncbi:hypothetical protein GUITHDRAFT_141128 [Guillardia theta CCMP2712]|uniref:Ion transport domain-containing protein n=2 Tax=Guillardia theta TaxID=55529 RepID=L1J2W6_GUITC|nr:hypothetical protein GUITHDRAFT_141128 [Guillardia theta CCMP2712]EKX42435.1 hypothetical protein GUITHDRAFT_141128 [Guillardia theta CCMP2712]|eukprot:XP_005829415.1 hypothetical protein GUITHDRAFT_141128 [Guillardia theta CCMP2712]
MLSGEGDNVQDDFDYISKVRHQLKRRKSEIKVNPTLPSPNELEKFHAGLIADVVIEHHVKLKEQELGLRKASQVVHEKRRKRLDEDGAVHRTWAPDPVRFRGKSLFLFSISHPLRYASIYILQHGLEQVMLILILINAVILACFDPHDTTDYRPISARRNVLRAINQILSICFGFECLIKIVAQGLLLGPTSFLSDGWGWMDLVIVVLGLMQDFLSISWLRSMAVLRASRMLRPLRAINKVPQLKLLVSFLLQVVPTLNTVLFLCTFIFFIFAIVGVQVFQGWVSIMRSVSETSSGFVFFFFLALIQNKRHLGRDVIKANSKILLYLGSNQAIEATAFETNYCRGGIINFEGDRRTSCRDELEAGRNSYEKREIMKGDSIIQIDNTDIVPLDLHAVYQLMVGRRGSRVTLTIRRTKTRRIASTPRAGSQENRTITEEVDHVIPLVRDLLPQMFEEEQYQKELIRQEKDEDEFWEKAKSVLEPYSGRQKEYVPFRERLRRTAISDTLSDIMSVIIVINISCLGFYHELDSPIGNLWVSSGKTRSYWLFRASLEGLNVLFLCTYVIEMAIKIAGLGIFGYIKVPQNLFDGFIVCIGAYEFPTGLSLIFCYLQNQDGSVCNASSTTLSVLRAFRLVRLVKFLRKFPQFQRQVGRIAEMLRPVATMVVLIMLFLFIYTILGMNLFGAKMWYRPTWQDIELGEWVYVDIPGDDLPSLLPGRPGIVQSIDRAQHPRLPYRVRIVSSFTTFGYETEEVWAGIRNDDVFTVLPWDNSAAISFAIPRENFDTFQSALLTVFQILTQTNWQNIMYSACSINGGPSALYFYALIFVGNYVLMNVFLGIVIVGFGDNKGQLAIIERDNRELAMQRFKSSRILEKNVIKALSKHLCNFPGPNCMLGGVSMWSLLQFREKKVATFNVKTISAGSEIVYDYDYVQIPMAVRDAAKLLLGSMNFQFLGNEPLPTATDIQRIILDLRTVRVLSRKRNKLGKILKSKAQSSRVLPALIVNVKNTNTSSFFIAVEYLFKFWERVEATEEKQMIRGMESNLAMTEEQMNDNMQLILEGADLTIAEQARKNVGDPFHSDIAMQLLHPDGSTRCQGVVGRRTQCPNKLDCMEHREVNVRFLSGYQSLKLISRGNTSVAMARDGENLAKMMRTGLQSSLENHSQDDVPYSVCGCITWNNPIRTFAGNVVNNPLTEKFIVTLILIDCMALATERPFRSNLEETITTWLHISVTLFFVFEASFKVLWYGLKKYSRNPWNRVDMIVVLGGITEILMQLIILTSSAVAAIRIIRIVKGLRALRPLRILAQTTGLRILLSTLAGAWKPIISAALVSVAVFLVIAILGMQVLSGNMHFCSDPMIWTKEACNGTDPGGASRVWQKDSLNFDWIGDGLIYVYVLASQDNWPVLMRQGIDSTGPTTGPRKDNISWFAVYYIFVIVIGGFFLISASIGVFVQAFSVASVAMESLQPPPRKPSRAALPYVFDPPSSFVRSRLYSIYTSMPFEKFLLLCIVGNIVIMSFESFHDSAYSVNIQTGFNMFFMFTFGIEAFVALISVYPRQYFTNFMNSFDMFVVLVSFASFAFESQFSSGTTVNPRMLRVVRVFRLFRTLRTLRILRSAKGLTVILDVLKRSVILIVNLLLLLVLVFYSCGVVGVAFFSHMCTDAYRTNDVVHRCDLLASDSLLSSVSNFQNLGLGMIQLFELSTRDMWSDVMWKYNLRITSARNPNALDEAVRALQSYKQTSVYTLKQEYLQAARNALPQCQTYDELKKLQDDGLLVCESTPCLETCGNIASLIFFPFFVAVASFILMNLVTAVLMRELVKGENVIQKKWKRNANGKSSMHRILSNKIKDLTQKQYITMEQFEDLAYQLANIFISPPDPGQVEEFENRLMDIEKKAQIAQGGPSDETLLVFCIVLKRKLKYLKSLQQKTPGLPLRELSFYRWMIY